MSNTILMNDGMRHPANPSSREDKFLQLFYYTVWMDDVDKVNKTYNQSFDSLEDAVRIKITLQAHYTKTMLSRLSNFIGSR